MFVSCHLGGFDSGATLASESIATPRSETNLQPRRMEPMDVTNHNFCPRKSCAAQRFSCTASTSVPSSCRGSYRSTAKLCKGCT